MIVILRVNTLRSVYWINKLYECLIENTQQGAELYNQTANEMEGQRFYQFSGKLMAFFKQFKSQSLNSVKPVTSL